MDQMARDRTVDRLGAVGRHWGWALAFGVLTVITGILLVVWPHLSLVVAAIFFGIQLIISAVFRFIWAFTAPSEHGWARVLMVIVAILSLIAGLIILRDPVMAVFLLGIVLGVYWITSGLLDIFTAIGYSQLPRRWLIVLLGLLAVVAGVIVMASPVTSLLFLAWVLGIWLIVFGLGSIVRAFMLRAGARSMSPQGAPQAT
jgi:uncharacterized membrane protein HdeD (DUF308 family)